MHFNCKIDRIASYLPDTILTNEDLEREFPDFKADKVSKKIGISCRHIAGPQETALDMAEKAARKLFDVYPEAVESDFILFCTQHPDYILPPNACILQQRLGMSKHIGALDFSHGCSGFVYGLALAKGLIAAQTAQKVLLVTSETYSKHLAPKDKGNRSIFGDSAAVTLISACEQEKIGAFSLGTDGSGAQNLIIRNGGARHERENSADTIDADKNNHIFMNGPEIFNFTIEAVPVLVENVLQKNNLSKSDIDHVIFHQANKYMLTYLMNKIGLPPEKFHIHLDRTGNTVSASIPLLMEHLSTQKQIKPGDRTLLVGFGVGYSYGAVVVTF